MRNRIIVLLTAVLFTIVPMQLHARGGHSSSGGHSRSSSSHTSVRSYTKNNGTHVSAYHRTKANKTKKDNFSTKGNVNPYTGKVGTKTDEENP